MAALTADPTASTSYDHAVLLQAFVATGFNLIMNFDTSSHFNPAHRQCDFEREAGKVRGVGAV